MLVVGSKSRYRTAARGVFHCERCGGDREYLHRTGRRWLYALAVPLLPQGGAASEHLRCVECGTCYRVDLLAVPTTQEMRSALVAATTAAVLAMLQAGGWASPAARRSGVELIQKAGSEDYSEASLAVAVPAMRAELAEHPAGQELDAAPRLGPAVEMFALQLEEHAKEWFLARIVQVGLADGGLTEDERQVARVIARHLGMSQDRAQDVIWLTEVASA
jgi:tellurite resistance protein